MGTRSFKVLQNSFGRRLDYRQQASLGAGLRWIRTIPLPRSIQPVDSTTNVLALGYLHTIWEDFYCQWIVGNLLSIGIQFCRRRIPSSFHLLCSVPFLKSSVHLRVREQL